MHEMHSTHDEGLQRRKSVVLEGVDRSGKSTLAELFSQLHYHVIHCPYRPLYKNMFQHYWALLQQVSEPVILDRSFITEVVYGSILRGSSRLSSHEFEELLKLLAAKNFVVFYLKEKNEILRDRLLQTLQEHGIVLQHLAELVMAYDHCMEKIATYVPTYTICLSDLPSEGILDHLILLIN